MARPEAETAGAVPARPGTATLAAFVAVVLIGGANSVAVKANVAELAPLWSAGLRFALAVTILVALLAATGRSLPRGRSLAGAALYGAVAFSGSFALIYPALREVGAGTTMILISLVPLLTLGLAVLHGQERFRARGLLGALVALSGVALVVADQVSLDVPLGSLLVILVGAGFIAEGGVILKAVPKSDPFATNAVAMLTGTVILLVVSLAIGESWTVPAKPATWLALGYLVIFGSIALFALYLFALRRWTASAVSYTTLLMPLVAVPLAAAIFSEPITPMLVVGGAVALVGVYVGAFASGRGEAVGAASQPECLPAQATGEATELAAPAR